MWTFLGIASFTYLYKKSDTVLTLAPKELVMAAALLLTAGLMLSYTRYFQDQKLRVSQVIHLPLSLLSSLPVINNFIPQSSTGSSEKAENNCKKVRQFIWRRDGFICVDKGRQRDTCMKKTFFVNLTEVKVTIFVLFLFSLEKKRKNAFFSSQLLFKHF